MVWGRVGWGWVGDGLGLGWCVLISGDVRSTRALFDGTCGAHLLRSRGLSEHACSDNPRERSTRAPKIRANGARVLRKSPRTEHSESRSKWSARQLSPRPPPSHPSPSPPPSHLSAPHPHPTQGPVPHHTTCSRFVAQLVDVHTNMTSDAQAHHRVAIQI